VRRGEGGRARDGRGRTGRSRGERTKSRERERERERDRVLGLGSSAKITASGVGTRPLLLGDSACVVQTRARRYSARGEDYRRVPQRAA